nr:GNAT family N-acetyltransferase [Arthrobacter roseus]
MPSASEVRVVYFAASSGPPLSETEDVAELFANVYATSLRDEDVAAAVAYEADTLTGFAYGHRWLWAEQHYEWASTLRSRLGEAAKRLDGAQVSSLLARHPRASGAGIGRAVLESWLDGIGPEACWLQTSDLDSPARRLYQAHGFVEIGHGPDTPNGKPGLVLFRDASAH